MNRHGPCRLDQERPDALAGSYPPRRTGRIAPVPRGNGTVLDKGDSHLFTFTAPADMKGTKALVLSPTQMYVFLPAFGKVRRIASSVSDQGFLGMTFSQDDLASQAYNATYEAKIASESATEYHLVVTPTAISIFA